MTTDPRRRVPELVQQAKQLSDEAARLTAPGRWRIVRMWHAGRAAQLVDDATALLDEAAALLGAPVIIRPPERWLGLGRTGWGRLQALVGTMNAYTAVSALADRRWIGAAVSCFCILLCASWRLPRSPRKPKR